jgi:apolipoprotein N-acyltransferase
MNIFFYLVIRNGLSAAFNSDGSEISKLNYFESKERIMYAEVPVHRRYCLYPYLGDFLPWLSISGFIIITIMPRYKERIKNNYDV